MALLPRIAAAGSLAAAPALLSGALLGGSTRAAAGMAAVAGGSLRLVRTAAETGTRAVGTLVTGADPIPDGHVRSLGSAARGMLEPPPARHTRRVSASHDRGHGHVQVEVAAPDAADRSELRRALRRQLERLEGVEWATVNDVVGRVLVGIDDRRGSPGGGGGGGTGPQQGGGGRGGCPPRPGPPPPPPP